MTKSMQPYLASSRYIDWDTPAIIARAQALAKHHQSTLAIAKVCFKFVRDDIKHSLDYALNPVTCKASEVLKHGTGYCYAKSHLLAALLRANNIPTGLCYQRLTISDNRPPFCLHGLNAVYLEEFGWHRIDARGNKEGVTASFHPPVEMLAYPIITEGEADLPEIWAEPLNDIITVLERCNTYQAVADNLPDMPMTTS
ncbi:MAG: Cro/Cl family transcriptional regulator [Nitrospirales bacterium]|nr:MAG: Cro/Cl family transcriptional regulator [Nitrospirales bacterium]